MDFDMPDADDLNQILNQGNGPGQDDETDEPEEPQEPQEPEEPDPNDLHKDDVKKYDTQTLVILDATESEQVLVHDVNEPLHKRICHHMEITAREITDFRIVKICLGPNTSEADFVQTIDNLFAGKTKKDLFIFHYHGSAGGVDTNYKWRFQGGPHGGINAYNFIGKLCGVDPDSMLLLDCYVHDKIADMWDLKTGNVELVTLMCKLQDGAGRIIHANDGYLTESVCRDLRAWRKKLVNRSIFQVAKLKPRSIPQVWAKDYTIKSKTVRIWFSRTRAGSQALCLRFRMDPMDVHRTGKISFKSYCIGPPKPEPVATLPAAATGEDEGIADMDHENPLFVPEVE